MSSEDSSNNGGDTRRRRRPSRSIGFPLILITLGVIFLIQQVTDLTLHNWWAIFILIPAFSAFGTAFALWQRSGYFHFGVWTTFYGGIFPLAVALIFFFDLDWGDYWPVFIILGGIGMMNSGLPFKQPEEIKVPRALMVHRAWGFFIGLSGTLLGFAFLGLNLDWFASVPLINFENWWGVFIIIPAVGGLLTAILLLTGGHSPLLAMINLAAAVIVAFVGYVALNKLDWDLINMAFPILLILAGLGLIVGFGRRKENDNG